MIEAVDGLAEAVTPGCSDIEAYLSAQVLDESHREVIGPLLTPSGASGVVRVRGERVAWWGDPSQPEMLFSATKTFVSLVAGVAFDGGLLNPDRRVVDDRPPPAVDRSGPRPRRRLALDRGHGRRHS